MNCEKLIYAELNEAELLLKGHKAERESRGEITRGELRGIIIELEEPKHSPQQEDDGTPCGEAAARQVEGQWLCDKHFDLADRRSKEHWNEGFEIEEAI